MKSSYQNSYQMEGYREESYFPLQVENLLSVKN